MGSEPEEGCAPTLLPSPPRSSPGLGQGTHQIFKPVILTAWSTMPWIRLRGPVGIRGKRGGSEAEKLSSSSRLDSQEFGGGAKAEAGVVHAAGRGLDKRSPG